MALATGTLTFALADLLGAIGESIDPTRVKVWVESNLPDGAVIDTTGNVIRVGNPTADVSVAGSGSFVGLPLTTFATGMQYRVTVEYPDAGTSSRKFWSSGWFDFTAAGDLADQDMQATAAPITWQTAFTDAMEAIADEARAYRDQAQDISGIATPDSLVAALVSASSGSATTAVLAALYADKAATAAALAGKIAMALIGVGNGVASLDSAGKVPVTQLPASVMEYQGVWNASTNTPTLADGTGNSGDQYRVNVAGTRNLGSGSQTFVIGDYVIYDGSVWQKAHGGADAVQSVAGLTGTITSTGLKTALAIAQSDVSGLTTALSGKQDTSAKGAANGYASLGSDGKVPAAQLPTSTTAGPIARTIYSPATYVTLTTSSPTAIDADATNLAVTFTAPSSGQVRVILEGLAGGGVNFDGSWLLREGTTALMATERVVFTPAATSSTARIRTEIVVSGLTPGSSHTYKWALRSYSSGLVKLWAGGAAVNGGALFVPGPAIMEVYAE